MKTPTIPTKSPDLIKGLAWSIFAVSATFGAFVLPAFILKIILNPISLDKNGWIVPIISLILTASTYFGLYRFSVFIEDIGLKKTGHILKILFPIIFSISLIILLFLNLLIIK